MPALPRDATALATPERQLAAQERLACTQTNVWQGISSFSAIQTGVQAIASVAASAHVVRTTAVGGAIIGGAIAGPPGIPLGAAIGGFVGSGLVIVPFYLQARFNPIAAGGALGGVFGGVYSLHACR